MFALEWTKTPRTFTGVDGIAGLGILMAPVAFFWPQATILHHLAPRCVFLHLTGLPCATCGFTRAFVRSAHFDLTGALAVSPFATLLFYTWAAGSLWVAAGWFAPRLRRLPRLIPAGARGPLLLRFGLPFAFLLNWLYLLGFSLLHGFPPE